MIPPEPIRIYPGKAGRIAVALPYTGDRIVRIKTLSGCRWDAEETCWTVPYSARVVQRLLALFSGDRVEVHPALRTPRPKHPGQRPALHAAPGPALEAVKALEGELKQNGYSPRTAKVYSLHVKRLFQNLKKTPQDIKPEEVRAYFLNLIDREGLSRTYHNQAASAIKFLYHYVLKQPDPIPDVVRPRRRKDHST